MTPSDRFPDIQDILAELERSGTLFLKLDLRVLDPLVGFGLLEDPALPGENPWLPIIEYRRTPLFDRFLRFELRPTVRMDPFLTR